MDLSAPLGATWAGRTATLIVIWLEATARSTPPLAVPPSSFAWKVKLSYGVPEAPRAGVNRKPVRLADGMSWPTVTGVPLNVSVPLAGSEAILIAARLLAGESFESLIGKSNELKTYAVWGALLPPRSLPTGASLPAVTPIAMVLGDWSRSMPPPDVPPLSCTWKVKLVYGE